MNYLCNSASTEVVSYLVRQRPRHWISHSCTLLFRHWSRPLVSLSQTGPVLICIKLLQVYIILEFAWVRLIRRILTYLFFQRHRVPASVFSFPCFRIFLTKFFPFCVLFNKFLFSLQSRITKSTEKYEKEIKSANFENKRNARMRIRKKDYNRCDKNHLNSCRISITIHQNWMSATLVLCHCKTIEYWYMWRH